MKFVSHYIILKFIDLLLWLLFLQLIVIPRIEIYLAIAVPAASVSKTLLTILMWLLQLMPLAIVFGVVVMFVVVKAYITLFSHHAICFHGRYKFTAVNIFIIVIIFLNYMYNLFNLISIDLSYL